MNHNNIYLYIYGIFIYLVVMEPTKEIKRLMAFKEKSGWSYRKIAKEIGVTKLAVINWFTKGTKPNPLTRKSRGTLYILY